MILSCAGGLGFWLGIPPLSACPSMPLRICMQFAYRECLLAYALFFTTKNRRVAPPFIPSWATSSARRLMGRHNIGDKQNVTKRIN